MASLVIAALPVHAAATILLAPTSTSPIKAATTDVREDDFLRLPIGNVAIASLRKMRVIWNWCRVTAGVAVMVCRGSLTTEQSACAFSLLRVTCAGPIWHNFRCMSAAQFLCTKCRPDSSKKSPLRGGIASIQVGRVGTFAFSSRRVSLTRRKGALTITARLLCAPARA